MEVSDEDGQLDRLTHPMNIWKPNLRKNYITTNNGEFYSPAEGKKWVPFGVNYMPSSGTGLENMQWFEHWLDSQAYDPEIVEADLQRIERCLETQHGQYFQIFRAYYPTGTLLISCFVHGDII